MRTELLIKKNCLLLIFLLSLIYSSIINPHAQEAVSFAFITENINLYKNNEWANQVVNQPFTLQIFIPYYLFKIGLDKLLINIIWQTITCFISFISVFYFSLYVSKSFKISFVIILILINHKFINTNFYGIYYPTHFFYFGQMGMYLTLLSFSLALLNKNKFCINVLILNYFMHGAWGLFNSILILFYFLIKKKFFFQSIHFFFLIFLGIVFFFTIIHIHPDFFTSYKEIYNTPQAYNVNENLTYEQTHKINFSIYEGSDKLFNLFKLIFFDMIFLIIFFLKKNSLDEYKHLFLTIFYYIIFFYIIIIFHDTIGNLLKHIHIKLYLIFERLIVSRALNLINLIIIIFSISFILKKIKEINQCQKIFNFLFLIFSLTFLFFGDNKIPDSIPYSKYINIFNIFIWMSIIFTVYFYVNPKFLKKIFLFLKLRNIKFIFNQNPAYYKFLFSLSFLFFLVSYVYYPNKIFTEQNNILLKNIKKKDSLIALGGGLYGNLDIHYFIDNPVILPNMNKNLKDFYSDLYCTKSISTKLLGQKEYDNFVDKCFSSKTKYEWLQIGKKININYVLVNSNNILNLNLVHKNDYYSLYHIN